MEKIQKYQVNRIVQWTFFLTMLLLSPAQSLGLQIPAQAQQANAAYF